MQSLGSVFPAAHRSGSSCIPPEAQRLTFGRACPPRDMLLQALENGTLDLSVLPAARGPGRTGKRAVVPRTDRGGRPRTITGSPARPRSTPRCCGARRSCRSSRDTSCTSRSAPSAPIMVPGCRATTAAQPRHPAPDGGDGDGSVLDAGALREVGSRAAGRGRRPPVPNPRAGAHHRHGLATRQPPGRESTVVLPERSARSCGTLRPRW